MFFYFIKNHSIKTLLYANINNLWWYLYNYCHSVGDVFLIIVICKNNIPVSSVVHINTMLLIREQYICIYHFHQFNRQYREIKLYKQISQSLR